MNWAIVFTILAVASALVARFFWWIALDKYNRQGTGSGLFVLSALWTMIWTALALGAWFA